jgi:flagellar motor switch protein FliN/FliY
LEGSAAANAPRVITTANPLHQIKTELTVRIGTAELTVGDLMGIREHQVVRLDRTIDQPVDILLQGQVIARGILVAVDDYFGVRITELPLPLKP